MKNRRQGQKIYVVGSERTREKERTTDDTSSKNYQETDRIKKKDRKRKTERGE